MLGIALRGIEGLVVDPNFKAQHKDLAEVVSSCKECVDAFVERISKFKELAAENEGSKWTLEVFKQNLHCARNGISSSFEKRYKSTLLQ